MKKFQEITGQAFPTYMINLAWLEEVNEISHIMKELGVRKYVYYFKYINEIIKYGRSGDHSRTYGDRIYRQAGHLPGWKHRLNGSSGSEMRLTNEKYYEREHCYLDRNKMSVIVVDLTNHESPTSDKDFWPKYYEREFLRQHIETFGCLPIGNIKDESAFGRKYHTTNELARYFFDGLVD